MTKGDPNAELAPAETSAGRKPRRWLLLLLVLVAGVNFFLGLLVGRGTSPLRFDILALQKELAALRETEIQAQIQRFRVAMEGSGTSQPLDFYSDLKKNDKIAKPIPAPVEPKLKKATEAPKPPAAVPAAAAGQPKPESAAAADGEKVPKPEPAALAVAGGKGPMVQVAALREAAAAEKIVARLRAQGFAASSAPTKTADRGTWYRIRIGPFADRKAADEARERLATLKYQAIIVNP